MPTSFRKIEANRKNARHSTGPRTPEGKARSSHNATGHGCSATKTVLLHNESRERLQALEDSYLHHFQPANPVELDLVHDLTAARWRLYRIRAHETASLDFFCDRDAAEIEALIKDPDPATRLAYSFEKQARQAPLSLELILRYEAASHRQYYKALDRLTALQSAPEPEPAPEPTPTPQPQPSPEPQPESETEAAEETPAPRYVTLRLLPTLLLCLYLLLPAPAVAAVKAVFHHPNSAKRTHQSHKIKHISSETRPATAAAKTAAAQETAK